MASISTSSFSGTAREYLERYSEPFRALEENQKGPICEFVRRVDKDALERELQCHQHLSMLSDDELGALQTFQLEHPLFQIPPWDISGNLPRAALRAFIAGRLSIDQISAIFLHHECTGKAFQLDKIKTLPLYVKGQRNEEAIAILKEGTQRYYTPEQIDQIAEGHQTERLYTVLVGVDNAAHRIISQLSYRFLACKEEGEDRMIIVSPRLMQALLQLEFGEEQAVQLNPVLGRSKSFKNFTNPSRRDLALPCRSLFPQSQMNEADGHRISPVEAYFHDLYHAWVMSAMPASHRQAFIGAAPLFEEIRSVKIHLYDLDFSTYARDRNEGAETHFKAALILLLIRTNTNASLIQKFHEYIQQHPAHGIVWPASSNHSEWLKAGWDYLHQNYPESLTVDLREVSLLELLNR